MKYGLTESEFSWLTARVIEPLKLQKAKVYIFGSRANGKYKKFSDVDICYTENPEQPVPSKVVFEIITDAQSSNFSYKLDLVNYSELADSYRVNVDAEKIEL